MRKGKLACVALVLLMSAAASAKDKKKAPLPDIVLNAQTVAVVILPEAGEPLTNPTANRDAVDAVERALTKWGRLRPLLSPMTADLVIAVRKGHDSAATPTIQGGGIDNRPVVVQRSDTDVRVGVQRGDPNMFPTQTAAPDRPRMGTEMGSTQDDFEVYIGNTEHPLEGAPIWRYTAKNALNPPNVSAVTKFKEAIEEAEKIKQKKP